MLRKKPESYLFQRYLDFTLYRKRTPWRMLNYFFDNRKFEPTFQEIFKFFPKANLFRWRRQVALGSLLLGIQSYLIFNKIYRVSPISNEIG
jgi:hypothetical protein